jgi:hypothetical protein
MPYVELGANYEFARPNGGRILTGDLSLATPSPWSYSIHGGARTLIWKTVLIEASAGYLSFGQRGLDAWEGLLRASLSF